MIQIIRYGEKRKITLGSSIEDPMRIRFTVNLFISDRGENGCTCDENFFFFRFNENSLV